MKKIVNEPFTLELEGQVVDCMIHSYEIRPEEEVRWDEERGYMTITIGDREPFEYAIWGGETLEECYICLPTMLEDSDDDDLEVYSLDVMLDRIEY